MRLMGEAYSERLRDFSDSTLQLMVDLDGFDIETALKKSEITTNSEYSEEEIAKRLKELLDQKKSQTM